MKTIIAAILGCVLGGVLGAGGIHQWLMPQLLESNAKFAEVEQKLAALQSESGGASERLALLEAERNRLSERLAALQSEDNADRPSEPVAPAEPALPGEEAPIDAAALDRSEPATGEDGARRGERGERGERWGGTDEEREAMRQEFVTRMRENMANYFTGELEKSSTPAMQERLVALEQKTQEMFDLRAQMRSAETDEEREALGQAFMDSMNSARDLMQEQQSDILGSIANQFGISKESDQVAFEQAVRSAMQSPMFSDNPASLLWGGGRGEGDGGPGRGGFVGGGFRGGPGR